jgi:hypothetical protein
VFLLIFLLLQVAVPVVRITRPELPLAAEQADTVHPLELLAAVAAPSLH